MTSGEGQQRLEAVVHGRVQGVGFRLFVLGAARALDLAGWVANESSGRVRVVAEGPAGALRRLVEQLREGPPGASVDRLDEDWGQSTGGFTRFDIRSGWHGGD